MTPTERIDFAEALQTLAMSYRGKGLVKEQLDAYWDGLRSHPWPWVEAAMKGAMVDYKQYFPSVGQLIAAGKKAEQDTQHRTFVTPQAVDDLAHGDAHCRSCDDTGFISEERLSTFNDTRRYARFCHCRLHNPRYQAGMARVARSKANPHGE